MAAGERVEPHVGELRAGITFTRYYWQLELDERCDRPGARSCPGARRRRIDRARAAAVQTYAAPPVKSQSGGNTARGFTRAHGRGTVQGRPAPRAGRCARAQGAGCGAPMNAGQDWCRTAAPARRAACSPASHQLAARGGGAVGGGRCWSPARPWTAYAALSKPSAHPRSALSAARPARAERRRQSPGRRPPLSTATPPPTCQMRAGVAKALLPLVKAPKMPLP